MSQNGTNFYVIDSAGVEQQIDFQKLRIEFQDNTNVTLEIDNKSELPEIVLRGYHGNEEYSSTEPEQFVILNIRPGACNLISVQPLLRTSHKSLNHLD